MLNRSLLPSVIATALLCTHVVQGQEGARREATPRLAPTRHAPVPVELSQFWFVSGTPAARMDADARTISLRIARGIKLINTGDFAGGVPLVNASDIARSPLAPYANYYEFGTARTAPHPTFVPIVNRGRQAFLKAVAALVRGEGLQVTGDVSG